MPYPEGHQWTEEEIRAEYTPRDQGEWGTTARALRDHRKYEAGREVVATLTRREQLLIEYASDAGRNSVIRAVAKSIGDAALTVDPKVVMDAARRGRGITADARGYQPLPPDRDLVDLVGSVQRMLDHETQTESGIR